VTGMFCVKYNTSIGFGITDQIQYSGFGEVVVYLSDQPDKVTVNTTSAPTTVNGGSGSDSITIVASNNPLFINGDADADTIIVTPNPLAVTNPIWSPININGGDGGDTYEISFRSI
jgi:hypothetical protein